MNKQTGIMNNQVSPACTFRYASGSPVVELHSEAAAIWFFLPPLLRRQGRVHTHRHYAGPVAMLAA